MPQRSSQQYLRPYHDAVRRFGANFSATLWNSREAQQTRFDVIMDMADLRGRVVLDAGCATGDFAERLLKRGVTFERYIGVDAVEELIAAARQRDLPGCEFHHADLFHDHTVPATYQPDWVCISGTLNTMDEDIARHLVSAAFDAARVGIVFNFLSNRAGPESLGRDIGPARRFNTVAWLDWAMSCTPLVRFAQDYLEGHDATIMMRTTEA